MKGKWIIALGVRVLDGSVSIQDAISFIRWRISKKDEIYIDELCFKNPDHILWSLISETFLHREYTPHGFEIQSNDIVIDVGAHKGVFTGFAARRTSNRILSLEPNLENFKCLEDFIWTNRLSSVTIWNYAIGSSDGNLKIYLSESSRHSATGIDQATGQLLQDYFEIPCVSLDTLLEEFDRVDFLKIDCEGAEYEAIGAASRSTLDKIKKCSLEIHNIEDTRLVTELLSKLKRSFDEVSLSPKTNKLAIVYARKLH